MMKRSVIWLLAAILPLATAVAQPATSDAPLALNRMAASLKWGPCPPIYKGGCALAVLHGDPAKPNADVFLRVDGGTLLHNHRHSSAERMILVSGTLRVAYAGSAPAVLQTGHYAYGPAGVPHEAACLSKTPCTLFIAFEGPVDADLVK
ncbi:cupin domain-containing protein [Sandarakinorhabdus sp.]|uniref:cupin domain-containing protein n=1 Tax=Sandarakinorhabdus sp. TaxID=1916663 RepID=UPI00286D8C7E|nr:cupin domain-containing protein [Sandarakinorhabdus sp.]